MFNALKYTKKLEEVGFTREQAEAHILIMIETIESNLATKQDIEDLRSEMISIKTELDNKIMQSEYRLTIKLGTIVSIAIGIAVTLAKIV